MKLNFLNTIRGKLVFFISFLVLFQLLVSFATFYIFLTQFVELNSGQKALNLAVSLSKMGDVISSVKNSNSDIQYVIENIRVKTDAAFIVIANKDGIRLTHPNTEMIGQKFVGGDYYRAVEKGESYVSSSVGTLGPSIRAFAPIYDDKNIIGFVSVGYLKETIFNIIINYLLIGLFFVCMMFFAGLVAVVLISNHIKKITLDLEPRDIANLYLEREIVFDSLREGIIAVDNNLNISFLNQAAKKELNDLSFSAQEFVDNVAKKYFIEDKLIGDFIKDSEYSVSDGIFLFNISKLEYNGINTGFVISFRKKDELDTLKKELLDLKKLSEILRIQSHEYSNKLHIIGGLIQLNEYEEAANLIIKESKLFHSFLGFIEAKIKDKYIAALLISKQSKAGENNCNLILNEESSGLYSAVDNSDVLVTALGNIIDNAIEAACMKNKFNGIVEVTINQTDNDIEFTVEDNGPGIPDDKVIFEKGFSTKGKNRGYGVAIAKTIFDRFNAVIDISTSVKYNGAKISIKIPSGKR
jgi:sensor histidine kinase regulating citrate/malate metabolism